MNAIKNNWKAIALCIFVTLVFVFPMLSHANITFGWDGGFWLSRINELIIDLKAGEMFPMVSYHSFVVLGYGVNFFYPFIFTYIYVFAALISQTIIGSFIIATSIITLVTAGLSFYATKKFSNSNLFAASFTALYTLSPTRFIQAELMDSLGMLFAATFLPLFLYACYELLYRKGSSKEAIILALSFAGIFYAHLLTAIFALIFALAMFVVALFKKSIAVKPLLCAGALFTGLSFAFLGSFFQATKDSGKLIGVKLNPLEGSLSSTKDFVISTITNGQNTFRYTDAAGEVQQPAITVGILGLIAIVALIYYVVKMKEQRSKFYTGSLILGFVLIMTLLKIAPWKLLNGTFVNTIQFPARYVVFVTIFLALFVSYVISKKNVFWAIVAIIAISGVLNFTTYDAWYGAKLPELPYITYEDYSERVGEIKKDNSDYYTYDIIDGGRGPLDDNSIAGVAQLPPKESIIYQYVYHDGKMLDANLEITGTRCEFAFQEKVSGKIDLPIQYYSGYVLTDQDGKKLKYSKSSRGTILAIANGAEVIKTKYQRPLLPFICNIISAGTLLGIIAFAIYKKIKR
ncbi:MAG: hypothetical protein LBN08_03010 [Lactobacillales bacterium]|nr:hypothetical protein [Lactobacillales bacterium]